MDLKKNTHHHHGKHENRPDLAGEYKYGDIGQLILLIIFLIVWILDSFIFNYSTFLSHNAKWYFFTIPGVIILIFSLYFSISGIKIVFNEVREPPEVIKKGVFSIVRHPVYFGAILALFGLTTLTLSLLSLLICIMGTIFYYFISRYEEKLMIEKFGKEYEDYLKKVPMLFPMKF
jgi:protein-S-isoprenylcysteine O-methyltransferase Ste14